MTITVPLQKINSESTAVSDDLLHQQAFENSLQANIVTTVSSGRILLVNQAACDLLEYSNAELLSHKRSNIFDITEPNFKRMLKERSSEGHSKANVTVITQSGRHISCEITSAVFKGEHGITKAITTIVDITERLQLQSDIDLLKAREVADNILLAQSNQKHIDARKEKIVAKNILEAQDVADAKFEENNQWQKNIVKTSYDVLWDWDIASGEIYVSDSILEVFGYTVKQNKAMFADFIYCLSNNEKEAVQKKLTTAIDSNKKTWSDCFIFIRNDGSVAFTTSRASIVRDEEGKAVRLIGALQDVSKLTELEKKFQMESLEHKEDTEKYLLAARLSFDVIWDWNLVTGRMFIGEGFEELFGYPLKDTRNTLDDWSKHIHPDDKEIINQSLQDSISSTTNHWEQGYRFIRKDLTVARVFGRAIIIRDANGKANRMIGAIHDISKQKILEERLETEILIRERQIAEATEDARDTERADIGKELHDNINQLLGASKMYLEMAKRGDVNSEMYLSRSSEYTITAIEEIRKLTKGLITDIIKNFGLGEAIDKVVRDTMEVNSVKISYDLHSFHEESINDKFKLNVFRIVQEQLNNILKHARASSVQINVLQSSQSILLSITDNGVGFDTSKSRIGVGISNIKSRAESYDGVVEFVSRPGNGCRLTVAFPFSKAIGAEHLNPNSQ